MNEFTLSLWDNFQWGLIYFDQFILCDHCLHDLRLYIWKMLINRGMTHFQKWDLLRIPHYTFTINCVTTGEHEICILSIYFALFVSNDI